MFWIKIRPRLWCWNEAWFFLLTKTLPEFSSIKLVHLHFTPDLGQFLEAAVVSAFGWPIKGILNDDFFNFCNMGMGVQALYHLSHTPNSFCLGWPRNTILLPLPLKELDLYLWTTMPGFFFFFWDRVLLHNFCQADLNLWSSYLLSE
jgi:hypothetical protein